MKVTLRNSLREKKKKKTQNLERCPFLVCSECRTNASHICSLQPVEKGKNMKKAHFLSNADTAINFLRSKHVSRRRQRPAIINFYLNLNRSQFYSQIKLVNINPSDIIEGKPSVVLGLIWTIILYFQVTNHRPDPHSIRSQS